MVTPAEARLLLAIVSAGKVSGINWEPVAAELGCNKKAAAERWRVFKAKLPLPPGKEATAAQAKLLLSIISSVQASGVDWEAVGKDLGCNKKAAAERWRVFRVKREKKGEGDANGQAAGESTAKKGGKAKAATKTTNGGGAKKPGTSAKKRKIEEAGEEEAVTEGGTVRGVNGAAKKRTRAVKENSADASVKQESGKNGLNEGEGSDREDVFHEAEEGYGEDAHHGIDDGSEDEI